ncbi:MAG: hypothetical protein DIJKHBIC_02511 [Thermoanaerobaculia bacterium]|nr:hypothetical protein [Thermoanaerobaculia bacterium]
MANPAWKTVGDIVEGYLSLSPVVLKRYQDGELQALAVELEKQARELRAQVIPTEDVESVQKKNRKLLRLQQATQVLGAFRSRRGGSGAG